MHYKIHNGARDTTTRTLRASRPVHNGLKQFIFGGERRLVRGRPIIINEEELNRHIEELRSKAKDGILYVTTVDEKPVNLETLEIGRGAIASNNHPEPRLDSASNDKPHGADLNRHPGESPPPKEFTMPVNPPNAATENPAENPLTDANGPGKAIAAGETSPNKMSPPPGNGTNLPSDNVAPAGRNDQQPGAQVPPTELTEAATLNKMHPAPEGITMEPHRDVAPEVNRLEEPVEGLTPDGQPINLQEPNDDAKMVRPEPTPEETETRKDGTAESKLAEQTKGSMKNPQSNPPVGQMDKDGNDQGHQNMKDKKKNKTH